MRPLVLRTESTSRAALVLAGALILLGGIPPAALASAVLPGIETCDLTATFFDPTSPPIVMLPTDRTYAVSTFTCTDTAPSSMFGMACSGPAANNTLGGTFDVHFAQSPMDPNVIDLTADISGITMFPFPLCGFALEVTSHVLNNQALSYNKMTSVLGGEHYVGYLPAGEQRLHGARGQGGDLHGLTRLVDGRSVLPLRRHVAGHERRARTPAPRHRDSRRAARGRSGVRAVEASSGGSKLGRGEVIGIVSHIQAALDREPIQPVRLT